jgi:ABC-type multidrug transport system fused ATPase/permease subunit
MKNNLRFRFAGIAVMLAMAAVFAAIVMLLWNVLIPPLFALPVLNYWQAAVLLLLARILFGGLEHGFHGGMGRHRFHHGNKLREKWLNMSDEERKEFVKNEKDFYSFNRHHFHRFSNDEENKKDEE